MKNPSFSKYSEGVSRQFINSVHLGRPQKDKLENMIREAEQSTSSTSDELEVSGEEQISKEIVNLKYFANQTDELLEG